MVEVQEALGSRPLRGWYAVQARVAVGMERGGGLRNLMAGDSSGFRDCGGVGST